MDELDRKILYEISENARESHNILAKKIRCSREVFDYRIKNLKEEGVITGSQARINISNFIYGGYIVLVQSSGLNLESERKIITKISKNSKTQYVGKISGEYDLILGFTVKNIKELSEYLDFINSSFGMHKSKITLLTMIKELKDSFKGLFSKNSEFNEIVSMPESNIRVSIDDVDKEIILSLGKNSEIPSWKIADKVKISEVAVRKRIEQLKEKSIILNFRTMIDLTKLDYQSYFLFINSNPKTERIEKEFVDFLKSTNNVSYSTKTIGEYYYVITLLAKTDSELKDFVYALKNKFSDMILEIHTSSLFDMPYHTQIAENLLETKNN